MNILLINGHPDLKNSNANKAIIGHLESTYAMEIRNLAELYPKHKFDVEAEQTAMKHADIIILQFPFYWYSMPGAMKLWLDAVFTFNFAYGPEGDKLAGKHIIISTTIGGPEEAYSPDGYNNYPIHELLLPLKQTALLAQCTYKPIWTHGNIYVEGVYGDLDIISAKAKNHATKIMSYINGLS